MRRIGLAIVAAALMIGAGSAHAQDKAAADAKAKPITKDQITRGMKEAPAVATAAHLPCTVTNAAYLGQAGKVNAYEVACKEGLGYVMLAGAGTEPTKAYDCLHTLTNANLACKLPENANPKAPIGPMLTAAGHPCTLKDARFIGGDANSNFYEASCQEGAGYVLETPVPGMTSPVKVLTCAETMGTSSLECTLTTKAQTVAAIAAIAAKSGKTCQVSDARYIGSSTTDHAVYYEVACGDKSGFVIQTDANGAFKTAVDCANAAGIAGGCKMTDTTKAETEESGNYTNLAKAGGFNCTVSKYRFIGMVSEPTKSEVVELACANRPDGVIAIFPGASTAKPKFVDCARAEQYGDSATCKLTSMAPIYAKYSASLAAKGRSSCKVSGTRYLGHSPSNTDYIETACADGNPGWVVEMDQSDAVKTLLSCGQAKAAGLSCQLPTNVKK
ncbi:MAG: hypothetical protein ACYDD1_22975 [Caulobacteraceae bacterium]